MGKMDQKEMFVISVVALLFSPFIIAGKIIKEIGISMGIIEKENYDYDPSKDQNIKPEEEK